MNWIIASIFIVAFLIALGFYWKSSQRGVKKDRSTRELIDGFVALIDSNVGKGIYHFKDAIKYDTNCITAYIVLGELLSRQGNYQEATRIYNSLLLRSNIPAEKRQKIQISLAENYLRNQNYNLAAKLSKQALAPKTSAKAYQIYLEASEALGNWDDAYQALLRMQKMDKNPEKYKSHLAGYKLEIGQKHLNNEEYEKARSVFNEAAKLDSTSPFPDLLIGDTYLEEGKLKEAIESWSKLAKEHPEKASMVFERIEKALYDVGDFQKITGFYRKLIENDLSKPQAAKALARIYFKMGDWERAIQTLSYAPSNDLESIILKIEIAAKSDSLMMSESIENLKKVVAESNRYICTNCGKKYEKPNFYCSNCGKFNTIVK
ncbi:MAG: tetratricopeptide repeat protein [Candidatus Zixiibacteriota bacterium]